MSKNFIAPIIRWNQVLLKFIFRFAGLFWQIEHLGKYIYLLENQQLWLKRQRRAYLDTDFRLVSLSKTIKIPFLFIKLVLGEVKGKRYIKGKTVLFTKYSCKIDKNITAAATIA